VKVNTTLIPKGAVVGAAVSGGEDSMALLHYLHTNAEALGIKVVVFNVDHSLRAESSLDSAFVTHYCHSNNIPVYCHKVPAAAYGKKGGSTENKAREQRYAFFRKCLKEGKADLISTGHHISDNAETVLLHILRGAGLRGASGTAERNGAFIRPLLDTPKEEIQEYIRQNSISYVTDATNADARYSRNFLRAELKRLSKKFPAAEHNLAAFAASARADDEFINSLCPTTDGAVVPECVKELPSPVQARAVFRALAAAGADDYNKETVAAVTSLFFHKAGARRNLAGGFTAFRDYDGVAIEKEAAPSENAEIPFRTGEINFAGQQLNIYPRTESDTELFYFDLDKIPADAVIRCRREGDSFNKFDGGTVKLKKFFIDSKVLQRLRDKIPLVAAGSTVYIIAGLAISGAVKTDENSERIYNIVVDGGW